MLNLNDRIEVLRQLYNYLKSAPTEWQEVKERAYQANPWFIPAFIDIAVDNIVDYYLEPELLHKWIQQYNIPQVTIAKNVGVVTAGNIPLVGFHDFLCVFVSGHKQTLKFSSRDNILLKHIIQKICEWHKEAEAHFAFADILKGCDAYIATGSGNTASYFEYYFGKYPSIIRKNRTSVAVLTGEESTEQLSLLADDINIYFGLGCRSITKIYVPEGYDFLPLLEALKKYAYFSDNHKYKNNYDFNLALHLVNQKYYMTNETTLVSENAALFSPISQLNYEYYPKNEHFSPDISADALQSISGRNFTAFGKTQQPALTDYADGIDTMAFLLTL